MNSLETIALSHARLGNRDEALTLLDLARENFGQFHSIALSMSVLSNGLTPAVEEMELLVALGDGLIDESCAEYSRFIFLLYKGLLYLHKELYLDAERILGALITDANNQWRSRMFARTRCYLAELFRRLGQNEVAMEQAQAALVAHTCEQMPGDLADLSLPLLAKLSPDAEATHFLDEAEATQRTFQNKLGLARVLALRARRLKTSRDKQEIELLQRTLPVLTRCAVARRIVRKWDQWICPPRNVEPVDYWGV